MPIGVFRYSTSRLCTMTLPFACTPAASSSSGIISVLFNLFMTYHRNGAAVPVFRSSKTSGALISFGLLLSRRLCPACGVFPPCGGLW